MYENYNSFETMRDRLMKYDLHNIFSTLALEASLLNIPLICFMRLIFISI